MVLVLVLLARPRRPGPSWPGRCGWTASFLRASGGAVSMSLARERARLWQGRRLERSSEQQRVAPLGGGCRRRRSQCALEVQQHKGGTRAPLARHFVRLLALCLSLVLLLRRPTTDRRRPQPKPKPNALVVFSTSSSTRALHRLHIAHADARACAAPRTRRAGAAAARVAAPVSCTLPSGVGLSRRRPRKPPTPAPTDQTAGAPRPPPPLLRRHPIEARRRGRRRPWRPSARRSRS